MIHHTAMLGTVITYATIALVLGLVGGLLPSFTALGTDTQRLKTFTALAAGILLGSAMLVVVPEGFAIASGAHDHEVDDAAVAGEVGLAVLEVHRGDINASTAIEAIEAIVAQDGHDHAAEEADAADEATFGDAVLHVIEEVEAGGITASEGVAEIEALLADVEGAHEDDAAAPALLLGGALIAGFLSMLLLEGSGFGHAVHEEHHDHADDHGHDHVHHGEAGLTLLLGLSLHAAADGLAVGAAAATGELSIGLLVLFAVLIHKVPAAFSLGVFSLHERAERRDVVRDVVLFALATPVAILVAYFLLADLGSLPLGLAMLFSAGTFLYVATVDTLPDIHNAETGRRAMLLTLAGAALMLVLLVLAGQLGLEHAH